MLLSDVRFLMHLRDLVIDLIEASSSIDDRSSVLILRSLYPNAFSAFANAFCNFTVIPLETLNGTIWKVL